MSDQPSQTTLSSPSSAGGISELPKAYKPADHEDRIRARWDQTKAFHADPGRVVRGEAEPYSIVIPPPNVTAALHLGHALNNTLQDILVRAKRMMGYEALWMPGTDHAGIATQAVVEKRLRKEGKLKGSLKQAFTRDAFVAEIQKFKDEYEAVITGQLKKMGCSCDWARQRFTMDEVCARAVREAFFRLFQDGLIYRGKRLVNWDPALQTAVADDECYDEDVDAAFYYLRYPLVHAAAGASARSADREQDPQPVTWDELARRGYPGADQHNPETKAWVTVATTRPETYLGDTAVAINPHDPRAKALRGLFVELPLVGRIIPILEDSYVVLPKAMARSEEEANDPKAEFATGFLKVTPAHDPNDYEIGRRHSVDGAMQEWQQAPGRAVIINMLAPDGTVSDKHGWTDVGDAHMLVGMKREEARKKVVEEFKVRELLESVKPYRHSVKHSDRSKAVIEPYLSDQWYVRVTDDRLAGAANRALVPEQRTQGQSSTSPKGHIDAQGDGDGSLRFHPARYAKTYEQWHDNIRDWCISRQLWWGHRIPVWNIAPNLGKHIPDAATDRIGYIAELRKRLERFATQCGHSNGFAVIDGGTHDDGNFSIFVCIADAELTSHWEHAIRLINVEANQEWPASPPGWTQALEQAWHELYELIHKVRGQDPDVLDTWFSSALWPLSTMGWPDAPQAAKDTGLSDFPSMLPAFNPTSTLCTAREIITLWVSRMVMFNRYFRSEEETKRSRDEVASASTASLRNSVSSSPISGPIPFHDVFIHAVIQDGEGRKMSKSLGNGVDPLDVIATHGADAMRFTLCQMATNTQDVRLPVRKDSVSGHNTSEKFDQGRNFCNKLWNAARFAVGIITAAPPSTSSAPLSTSSSLSLTDRWMLTRLETVTREINSALDNFEFAHYAHTLYALLWNDFCDKYLEAIKPTVAGDPAQRAVLRGVLDAILRLLHPIAPFVTEAIYETVRLLPEAPVPGLTLSPPRKDAMLCTAGWPVVDPSLHDAAAAKEFDRIDGLAKAIREVRSEHKVAPKRKVVLHVPRHTEHEWTAHAVLLAALCGLDRLTADAPPTAHVVFTYDAREYSLSNLADAVDLGAEKARLEKVVADNEKLMATLEARLANPGYAQRAPAAMVQQTKDQLAKAIADRSAAAESLKNLG